MALELTKVEDKEPQIGGWYIVQDLSTASGYMIARYRGLTGDHKRWESEDGLIVYRTHIYPWYWDNPLINVQAD